MEKKFEFGLGEIVCIDPTGADRGPRGRVVGHIRYIGGDVGYLVSAMSHQHGTVARHILDVSEIHRPLDAE